MNRLAKTDNDMSQPVMFEELGAANIAGSQRYAIKSKYVAQTFQIDVALPNTPVPDGQKLPVVFVLDGNGTFGLAAQTARMLQDGGLAPMVIVGIGYRFDPSKPLRAQYFETRARDYTPTADLTWLAKSGEQFAKEGLEVNTTTGGAAAFLRFIDEELKPFVTSRYPVDVDDQTLTGMSLGGLFTLYAFFAAPEKFARYGAFSPSLWWNGCVLFDDEAALAARDYDINARMFLSVGAREEAEGRSYAMVSNLERMKHALESRNYANLRLTHTVFAEEVHMSVFPASFSRGIRDLFS